MTEKKLMKNFVTKHNRVMTFGQLMQYYKRKIFTKKFCKKWDMKTSVQALYFKRIFCKKGSEEVYMLILTYFDNLIPNIFNLFQKFHFLIEVVLNSL